MLLIYSWINADLTCKVLILQGSYRFSQAYNNKIILDLLIKKTRQKKITMGILRQFGQYLFFIKKDPEQQKGGSFTKYMHGINRISFFLFLVAMIILVIKLSTR